MEQTVRPEQDMTYSVKGDCGDNDDNGDDDGDDILVKTGKFIRQLKWEGEVGTETRTMAISCLKVFLQN
jgi:hypothetical protein